MKIIESKLPFSYKTIKVTQSRIDKGLLAIPVSLIDYFPKNKNTILIATGISVEMSPKHFTPYTSSSRECRIGGIRNFYEKYQVRDGDEIVVQILDVDKYRLYTENQFENLIKETESQFDHSKDEEEATLSLEKITKITNSKPGQALLSEYYRLAKTIIKSRKKITSKPSFTKESVSPAMRKLLTQLYDGKCQVTGFGFLMKNKKPYFEIHHIEPDFGDHLKNLLVVSPNIHAEFTYTVVEQFFDSEGWMRRVKFNSQEFTVNHIIDKLPARFKKEVHYEK